MSLRGALFGDLDAERELVRARYLQRRGSGYSMRRVFLAGLGDLICIEGDCTEGQTNVEQLNLFFQSAGSPAKWSAAVGVINDSYNTANDSLSRKLVPFSTACCQIKAIGEQAKALAQQIATDTGVAPLPELKAPESGALDKAIKGAVVVGGILALKSLIEAYGRRGK